MENVTRRNFVGLAASSGLAVALGAASQAHAAVFTEEGSGNTPAELAEIGGSSMSVAELNARRDGLVDSKGEFTCEDGTVISAPWVKLRTLVNTYGFGCGSELSKEGFNFFKVLFEDDEEQVEAYLSMPRGVEFTAAAWADKTGRDESECLEMLEDFANRGLLWRARRSGVPYFHQIAVAHGIYEYNLDHFYDDGWMGAFGQVFTADYTEGYVNAGTAFYYAIPCDESVVTDEKVLILDDYKEIVARNPIIGVSPCQCRLAAMVAAGEPMPEIGSEELKSFYSPVCDHPLETCLSFGEEASYYIEKGIARQVTQEEALSILERSVEEGMILQSAFTKDSEIICSCHSDCCGILGTYQAIGVEGCETASCFRNNSNYVLNYDEDTCIKCGMCAQRCPMFAITMDEESGLPVVDARCMRCGQCGVVCPAGARTLAAKPAEKRLELPDNLLEDYNLQAAYRFDHGDIY